MFINFFQQFEKMKKSTVPEIHRCNLSAVSLTLLAMNKNPHNFNFIDQPEENVSVFFICETM